MPNDWTPIIFVALMVLMAVGGILLLGSSHDIDDH